MRHGMLAALLLAAPALTAIELKQVVDFQGAASYTQRAFAVHNTSGLPAGSDTVGSPGHLLYLPLLTLGKNEYFAPVLMIDAKQNDHAVIEDAFLVETVDFIAKPAWKYLDADGNMATLYGTAKRRVSKMVPKDDWSKGLYDYEEFGGGLGFSKAQFLGLKSMGWDLSLMRRGYANWHNDSIKHPGDPNFSLIYNYYEKDMLIPSLNLDVALSPSSLGRLTMNYTGQMRNYVDSYVVLPDSQSAVSPTQRRMDYYHSLSLESARARKQLATALNLQADYYQSNQNYWDFVKLQYFEDYYSFYSFTLAPEVSLLLQGRPDGHKLTFGYSATLRNYVHRNIRNADASQVSKGAQADFEQVFSLSGSYVITKWMNVYAQALHSVNRSNQEYEPTVKYSYDLFQARLGIGLHY